MAPVVRENYIMNNDHLLVFLGPPMEVILLMGVWAILTILPLVYVKKRRIRS